MTIKLADGRSELWQWDTGRKITFDDANIKQAHFQNHANGYGRTIDVDVEDGAAKIPDELLQAALPLTVYAYIGEESDGYTKVERVFTVKPRKRPAEYVFTPADQLTLRKLESMIGNLDDLTTTAKNNLVAAINEAAKTGSGGAGSIDLRTADGYIQYSNDGGATWENLIALADLKGEKGDTGAPGPQGVPGEQGPQGETGPAGPQGKTGPAGQDGAPGKDGSPGKDGTDGAPGQDGFSPSASVAETATGATITITDKTGTTTAEIKNGKDGATGEVKSTFYVTVTQGDDNSVTADKTAAEVYAAYVAGYAVYAIVKFRSFDEPYILPLALAVSFSEMVILGFGAAGATDETTPRYWNVAYNGSAWLTWDGTLAKIEDIPTELKNPYSLNIKIGDTTTSYDGSAAKTVEIPEGVPSVTTADNGKILRVVNGDWATGDTDESLGITSATVGQIAKITAVDAAGKPTAWSPVDMPTGGGSIDLGLTGAAVGDIIKVKSVDTAGKPTAWENVAPPLGTLKTRYDTIVDYTFNGTSTLSTAEGLSDYILWNGCKAVWNKDAQGNPLKAVRMWGYIECTKAVTQEAVLSSLKLSAACRGSYFYQDIPSSWYYGDDIGNGVGTYELNDELILNSKSIPIHRTTYGWCDHIARFGAVQSSANATTWTGTLKRSFAAARVPNLVQANYYKDYIYAAMLLIGAAKSDYIIPDGVRIVVIAEVIDE